MAVEMAEHMHGVHVYVQIYEVTEALTMWNLF